MDQAEEEEEDLGTAALLDMEAGATTTDEVGGLSELDLMTEFVGIFLGCLSLRRTSTWSTRPCRGGVKSRPIFGEILLE